MRPLVYLSDGYPKITQTFTLQEVRGLHADGLPVEVHSLHEPAATDPALEPALDPPVTVLPSPFGARVLAALLRAARRRPLVLLRLVQAIARPRTEPFLPGVTLRGPLHLAWGAWVAERLPRRAHVHAQFSGSACTVAWVASRLARSTFSFTAHSEWGMPLLREKLRDAELVIAISEHERGRLLARAPGIPPERVVVSHLGVDVGAIARARSEPAGTPRLLAVGALGPTKGHEVLLRAVALLRDRGVGFHLDVVGDGPFRDRLERLKGELSLAAHVDLHSWLPHDRVLALTREAAVVVLACRCTHDGDVDGIPVALMEGMAAGRATLSTRVGGIPELIEDGRSGRLVEPDSPEQLAEALEELLGDAALRERLGGAARRRIEERFEVTAARRRVRALLSGLLNGSE